MRHPRSLIVWPLFVGAVGFVLWHTLPARPHQATTGWVYPVACCSGYDCREVPASAIAETAEGYVIRGTGEVIPYSDPRVRSNHPDGLWHWCSVAGAEDGRTICLFVPPKSF